MTGPKSPGAVVLLAPGFEEIEAITPIDLLRRADIPVQVLSIGPNLEVRSSRGLRLIADAVLQGESAGSSDPQMGTVPECLILPGGPGAKNLAASKAANMLVQQSAAAGCLVAAICAAPAVVLGPLDLLSGHDYTCFPEYEHSVAGAKYTGASVTVSGSFITALAAAASIEFALQIIASLRGPKAARKVGSAIHAPM